MNETEDYTSPATAIMTRNARSIQAYGHLIPMPLALHESARQQSVDNLNQLLADTMTLRDMYKKHHWQVSGPMFYQLHLLFDKHYATQAELVDTIAERIMTLGGVSIAMAQDVADNTTIPQPPKDRECPESQLTRLLQAHEITLQAARSMARQAIEVGDDGTNDMLVSDVIRANELQVWFVSQHLLVLTLTSNKSQRSRSRQDFGRRFQSLGEIGYGLNLHALTSITAARVKDFSLGTFGHTSV